MDDQNPDEVAPIANEIEQLVAPRFLPERALAALPQRRMGRLSMLAHIAGVVTEEENIVQEAVAAPMVNATGDVEAEAEMAALVAANENAAEGNTVAAVFFQALWALLVWLVGAVVFVLYHCMAWMARQTYRELPHFIGSVFNSVQSAWLWLHGSALPQAWGLVLGTMRLAGVAAVHLIRWLNLAWTLLQVAFSRVFDLILGWPHFVSIVAIYCLNQIYFAWTWMKANVFRRVWDLILSFGGYFVADAGENAPNQQDDPDAVDDESLERMNTFQELLTGWRNCPAYQECLEWARAHAAAENHGHLSESS